MSQPDAHSPIEVPYEVLAATAPDAIVTVDESSRILSVNPATERIFGWRADEMIGRSLDIIMPEEMRERHHDGMTRFLRTGERQVSWSGVQVSAITKDGRRIPIEVSFGMFMHQGRRIFSGFLRDVSDRLAQKEALTHTAEQLEQALTTLRERVREAEEARHAADSANAAKSQFLATMSHELRTPLNAIGGYVELLESGVRGPVTAQQREDLARVGRAQERLLVLVNDVLNFARIETGRIEYDVREVPVNPMLCALGPLLDPQVRAKSLEYECDPGPPSVMVCADQQKLEQILLNLLSNAVKFTPEGGRITVSTDSDEDSVRLHVRDTGMGIPPDRLETVFEPFVQVDSTLTRVHGGTGLGLAISQELARGMGGLITVDSTLGKGTEFTVTLPSATSRRARGPNIGDLLARDARAIVRGMVTRLRADAELPAVTDAELEDHMALLVTDLAQLLVIIDSGSIGHMGLVVDGARIQETIVGLHGSQRRRLGWSRALLEREFDWLAGEAGTAIRRHLPPSDASTADEYIDLVRALLERAKVVGLRSFEQRP